MQMNVKSFFPLTKHQTYLNTAASGLLPKPVFEEKQKDLNEFYEKGSGYLDKENQLISQTKEKIARIFNANDSRIAITPNFSLAYNAVLDALPETSVYLCLDEDYFSVVMPIKQKGLKYHSLPISHNVEEVIYDFVSKNHIDVLSLSMVQYLSGIKVNVEFFRQLKKDFPQLKILVDATQYLGTEAFDFEDSGIDLLISSCYKWLNAGYGNAITLMSETLYQEISPKQIGANSYFDKVDLKVSPMGYFEPGHYDLNSIVGLGRALEFHYEQIGIESIEKQICSLSVKAFEQLKSMDLIEEKVKHRGSHSGIFMLKVDQERFDEFKKAKIILSKRGQGLRISFNYFNTFDDLEQLIDFLKP
jgi:selenocysteine lyase/cysteine desulfurase